MAAKDFDLLISGGVVYDGLGRPGSEADVALKGDRIARIAAGLDPGRAAAVIDARGLAVAPGFIDAHSHTDIELLVNPRAESKIRQGVTTEIAGNCGYTVFPLTRLNYEERRRYCDEQYGVPLIWRDLEGFFSELEGKGMAVNYATFMGHGTLRSAVFGAQDRPPSPEEMAAMKELIRQNMEIGALGLSTGLIYVPGCYADREELISLCRETAVYGGMYSTHMRNESDYLVEAVEEAIHIAQEARISLQISHLKLAYPRNWSKIHWVLSRISEVNAQGLEILADRYPYTASSTVLSAFMPPWIQQGTTAEYLARLEDPANEEKIRDYVKIQEEKVGSWDNVFISSVLRKDNEHLAGKSIRRAAREAGKEPYVFIRDLLISEEDQVWMINFSLNEDNFKRIILHPLVVIGSDGWARAPYGPLGRDKPHPRSYGTFPRMLGRYVREEGIMSLERAIEKMTSLTARKFGIYGRGQIKEGNFADVVIFDPDRIIDRATWTEPHRYPEGIPYVIVNGRPVIHEGEHTGELPGRILRKRQTIII
ncbi:MAG TPA: D-aminoacylase [Syntrophales bacterium]|jgi:N-acyl-D-amino-acid deacylase|nr:D-aminoacylase [Syntrophales bacterium]HOU77593.1 D-aminoacylase [Syntrophales bacterium]HPC32393.1 D-aminoacylase [Syntrophales bacterium]HQG34617.1 D-aminoacylase [Syntrophales bacterium]HQI36329.1 D-aminoacylase [Syntrophales bacterium]